jgi:hypothetical protein
MQNNKMEQMKKIIEEKKQASAEQGYKKVAELKQTKGARKAIKKKKSGGLFDR